MLPRKVLVVEDFRDFRVLVCSLLQQAVPECQIESASDGLEALQKATRFQPDLILLDLGLPNLNGLEIARRVRDLAPSAKILFLSIESDADVVGEALSIAGGYVHKSAVPRDLLPAIERVFKGERFVSGSLLPAKSENRLSSNLQFDLSGKLARAIEMAGADMGNVQILDLQTNNLHIVAQFGFSTTFLDFFRTVPHNQGSCGTALARGQRVIVDDVASDPIFQGTKSGEVVLGDGVRAVQSIPLRTLSGQLVGVMSTHFRAPKPSRQRLLGLTEAFAQEVADLIGSKLP